MAETTTPADPANPLDEAAAVPSLDAFYGKEADDLTDEEIDQLIAAHRAERDRYEAAELAKEDKAAKRAAKKAASSKRKAKASAGAEKTPELPLTDKKAA